MVQIWQRIDGNSCVLVSSSPRRDFLRNSCMRSCGLESDMAVVTGRGWRGMLTRTILLSTTRVPLVVIHPLAASFGGKNETLQYPNEYWASHTFNSPATLAHTVRMSDSGVGTGMYGWFERLEDTCKNFGESLQTQRGHGNTCERVG